MTLNGVIGRYFALFRGIRPLPCTHPRKWKILATPMSTATGYSGKVLKFDLNASSDTRVMRTICRVRPRLQLPHPLRAIRCQSREMLFAVCNFVYSLNFSYFLSTAEVEVNTSVIPETHPRPMCACMASSQSSDIVR